MSDTYRAHVDPDAPNNPHSIALRLVGNDRRVLEIGCWVGHVTEQLVANGNHVVGVERDPTAADEARQHAARVHVVDLDTTPLSAIETERFDVILLGDVLEHLRDPSAVLGDLVGLLEPHGRLVVSVPNVAHVDLRLHLLGGRWDYQPDGLLDRTHLRWFTRAGLHTLLDDAGFVATRLDPVRQGRGASLLPIAPAVASTDILRLIEADPDWDVYQFVVEARRRADEPGFDDALATPRVVWPDLDAEAVARADEVAALRAEVAAWHRSRVVRWSQPVRSLRARLRSRR